MELQFKHIYGTDVLVCGLVPAGTGAAPCRVNTDELRSILLKNGAILND